MHPKGQLKPCSHHSCSHETDIKKISKVLVIIVLFMLLELWGHWKTNSLSLLADALHLLVDILGFVVSLVSLRWSSRSPDGKMTFGYHRVEILGSLVSILLIWAAVGYLMVESFHKYIHPTEVDGGMFFGIAVVGFFVNCLCVYCLHHDEYHQSVKHKSLNIRATYVHVIGDLIQSIGVIIAGMITYFYPNKTIVDVICTVCFSIMVLVSTTFVLKDAISILAESAPKDLNMEALKGDIMDIENVYKITELNAWSLSTNRKAVSLKILADELLIGEYESILMTVNGLLKEKYNIDVSNVQIDTPNTYYRNDGFVVDGTVIDMNSFLQRANPQK